MAHADLALSLPLPQPVLLLGPPLIIFCVYVAIGVYDVVACADRQAEGNRSTATAAATDFAASFVLSIEQTFTREKY